MVLFCVLVLALGACGGSEGLASVIEEPQPTISTVKAPEVTKTAVSQPTVRTGSQSATLTISSKGELLEFDQSNLTIEAGEEVRLSFRNNSKVLQHNWVLVRNGTKDIVATDGMPFQDNGYIKIGDERVIASVNLVDPGESGQAEFIAPAAGIYQFVCTFPAHNFTMWGTLEVSP